MASFLKFSARNLGFSRVVERLALAALDAPDYYEGVRRKMAADRKCFYERLRRFDAVRVYDSEANFVLVRFPSGVCAPLKAALKQRGLVVKFFDEPAFVDCARISLGTQEENAWLLDSIDELCGDLLRRCA